MTLEIFTICDNAQLYGDKFVIVGPFTLIRTTSLPTRHPGFSIVLRLRYGADENGPKKYMFTIKSPDGNDFVPPMPCEFNASTGEKSIGILNLNLNFPAVIFSMEGEYTIRFEGENHELSQSFWVAATESPKS